MWSKSLSIAVFALMTTACASSPPQSPAPPTLPASLRPPCPPLPQPTDGTAAAVLRWAVDVVALYQECASRQANVVGAVQREK